MKLLPQERPVEPTPTTSPTRKAWHKSCPECERQVHIRKASCDCGHVFVPRAASKGGEVVGS